MTTKVTAIAMSACAVGLFLFSTRSPNDVYFAFVSNNIFIGILRLAVMATFVNILYRQKFVYKKSNLACGLLGAALIAFGLIQLIVASFGHEIIGFIKPFDFLFFIGIGCMFSALAVGFKGGRKKLPSLSRPLSPQLQLFASRVFTR